MSASVVLPARSTTIRYPESDGQPMAENTLQFDWIVLLKTNIDRVVPHFVAGDLLWYPVEGHPEICTAPDVLVAIGRPKGKRGSYLQWHEEGVAPQVVIEVWSPSNSFRHMLSRLAFYDRHGVQEFYSYDPERNLFTAHQRRPGGSLEPVEPTGGLQSPLLGITFVPGDEGLAVYDPEGRRFRAPEEAEVDAIAQRERADAEQARADAEQARAEAEQARADAERTRADALAARLRALGVDPDGSV